MTRIPEISICIPAYNHRKYIAACLDSALRQTRAPSEVIVTDDGSTDGTADLVEGYGDARIRLFRHAANRGPSAAVNNCLRHAGGEYLCLLASDDAFHPEKLERQADYMDRHPEVGLLFSKARYVDEEGAPTENPDEESAIPLPTAPPREVWLADFFHGANRLPAPTVMMRRRVVERVGDFDPRLLQTQDLDFWIRAAMHFEIHVLPEALVDYRVRADKANASADTPDKQARTHWEMTKVLHRFRAIDEELFFRIFPDALPLRGELPLEALLAAQAVQADQTFTRNFGLDLLFELLKEPAMAERLEAIGFGFPGLFKLAANAAVFAANPDRWVLGQAANWKKEAADWKAAYTAEAERGLRGLARRLRRGLPGRS